jgi:hypothetical protein
MNIVRIIAKYVDGTTIVNGTRLIIMAGIDDIGKLIDGEWYGHMVVDDEKYPFMLHDNGVIDYGDGYDIHSRSPSDLKHKKLIKVNEYISVMEQEASRTIKSLYKITTVIGYNPL